MAGQDINHPLRPQRTVVVLFKPEGEEPSRVVSCET